MALELCVFINILNILNILKSHGMHAFPYILVDQVHNSSFNLFKPLMGVLGAKAFALLLYELDHFKYKTDSLPSNIGNICFSSGNGSGKMGCSSGNICP